MKIFTFISMFATMIAMSSTLTVSAETIPQANETTTEVTVTTSTGLTTTASEESEITTITETTTSYELYNGYIVPQNHLFYACCYPGGTFNLETLKLKLLVLDENGKIHYSDIVNCTFTGADGLYTNCYEVDMSEVDFNKLGSYSIKLRTIGGEKAVFHSVRDGKPAGDYLVEMVDQCFDIPFHVISNEPDYSLRFTPDYVEGPVNTTQSPTLWNVKGKKLTFTVADETIAVVRNQVDYINSDVDAEYVVVEFLKEGKTTLTVTSDDGQTATIRLIAISQEEYDRRQQTTVYSDSETTTTTTYTETTSVETSENQNSTTEETTSTVAATTETTVYTSTPESETTATSDSDLPQTGRNSLNQVAVVFSALLMISTGAWAMRSTGFLRHKDDET